MIYLDHNATTPIAPVTGTQFVPPLVVFQRPPPMAPK